MSVPNPAAVDWVPLYNLQSAIPIPPVNGQWLKGSGGAVIWAAITPQDIAGYPGDATKFLAGDATWKAAMGFTGSSVFRAQLVPQQTIAFPANDASGNSGGTLPLPVAWPNAHLGFAVGYMWPLGHWNFSMKLVSCSSLNAVTFQMNQAGGAQNMSIGGVSFGY